MKILFDFQIFSLQNYGGISRYHVELIKQFSKSDEIVPIVPFLYSNNELINSTPFITHKTFFKKFDSEKKDRLAYLINRCISKLNISCLKFDILHPTYYDPYILHENKPLVITIHDMIHEKFPELFSKGDTTSLRKRLLSEKADIIIAVSEQTKRDIIEHFGIKETKIRVVYHGSSMDPSIKNEISISFPFILYVGNRNRYKNFIGFCGSIIPFLKSNPEIKILCAGGGSFSEFEIAYFDTYSISDQIQQLSVNDQELTFLYQQALMFVFPSFYEGFGIPLLEAFTNGCPVICSSIGAFKEVAQNAVYYFDPNDPSSMLQAVIKLYSDYQFKNQLIDEGRKKALQFTWEQCAKQSAEVYSALI